MKDYYEVGFEGPMRLDACPKMLGAEHFRTHPGHYVLGKVLAIGYVKGLAGSIEKTGY